MICSEQEYSYGLQLLNILAEHLEYVTVCPAPHDSATCSALQATFVGQHELLHQELRKYEARACAASNAAEPTAFTAAPNVSETVRGMVLLDCPRENTIKAERLLAMATEQVCRIEARLAKAQIKVHQLEQTIPINHKVLGEARTDLANYSELLAAWVAYRDQLAHDAGGAVRT